MPTTSALSKRGDRSRRRRVIVQAPIRDRTAQRHHEVHQAKRIERRRQHREDLEEPCGQCVDDRFGQIPAADEQAVDADGVNGVRDAGIGATRDDRGPEKWIVVPKSFHRRARDWQEPTVGARREADGLRRINHVAEHGIERPVDETATGIVELESFDLDVRQDAERLEDEFGGERRAGAGQANADAMPPQIGD
jgi:hypothetical protein